MIDVERIDCSSRLFDSCGIVFKHNGRILRALSRRGRAITDMLHNEFDCDKLSQMGFLVPSESDLKFEGYEGLVETPFIRPLIGPSMWNADVLVSACVTLCRLCREFLLQDYVLWDLGSRDNMAYHGEKGPLFLDMGALHSIEELEGKKLSTSFDSLLGQVLDAFLIPIWFCLGPMRNNRSVVNMLNYSRLEPRQGPAKSMLRRIALHGQLIPGYRKAKSLIRRRQIYEFYEHIEGTVLRWYEGRTSQAVKAQAPPLNQDQKSSLFVDVVSALIDPNRHSVLFNVGPNLGREFERRGYNCDIYELSQAGAWPQLLHEVERSTIVCDVWDRTFTNAHMLSGMCDYAICSDFMQTVFDSRLPLDYAGKVLTSLSTQGCILGIASQRVGRFPGIDSAPHGMTSEDFVCKVIGKYLKLYDVQVDAESGLSIIHFKK